MATYVEQHIRDSAASGSDRGIVLMGIRNDLFGDTINAANGKYGVLGLDGQGRVGIAVPSEDRSPRRVQLAGGTAEIERILEDVRARLVGRVGGTVQSQGLPGSLLDLACDRGGVLYVVPGHPDSWGREWTFAVAQTNAKVLNCPPGKRIVVTLAVAAIDGDCLVNVACRLGLGQSGLPTATNNDLGGCEGIALSHPDIPPGAGLSVGPGKIVEGRPGDNLYLTCDAATGGSLKLFASGYFEAA